MTDSSSLFATLVNMPTVYKSQTAIVRFKVSFKSPNNAFNLKIAVNSTLSVDEFELQRFIFNDYDKYTSYDNMTCMTPNQAVYQFG